MSRSFVVALSGDFLGADGKAVYPDFDTTPLFETAGISASYISSTDIIEPQLIENVDALILLGQRFSRESIPESPRLSIVARFGVGFDTVDIEACTEHGIAVTITPDGVRRPVAVAILTLMLALTGRLISKDRLTRQGADGFAQRSAYMGYGLEGKTLGSLGVGNIGQELFRVAAPLGMRHIAYDPYLSGSKALSEGIESVTLDELFEQSDVLSINCPLTADTHQLVNSEKLALMKKSAFLINTSRGAVVDQAALTQALQSKRIAGAGLDVFDPEPTDPDDPLMQLDNVILTPHSLCWTDQCFAGIGASAIESVLAVFRGSEPSHVVNKGVLDHADWRRKLAGHQSV